MPLPRHSILVGSELALRQGRQIVQPQLNYVTSCRDSRLRYSAHAMLKCAVERRAFLAGANPARQLSLQPVVARAVHGGNDMS